MENDNNTGYTPIRQKFLGKNDLFGVEFKRGTVFLEVEGREDVSYSPHDNLSSVTSQSDSGYNELQDPDNADDKIVYVPDGKQKVLHVGMGHFPPILRRYTRYGDIHLREHANIGKPDGRNGDDFGHIDGERSPYEEPTDAEELLVVPNTSIEFNFYNPDNNNDHSPVLNIPMMEYNIKPLNPNRAPHRKAIKRVASPGSPMPIFKAGGLGSQVRYQLETDWGVPKVKDSQIENIVGGN